MATYEIKPVQSKDRWEEFVLAHDPKSFLQSWNWGETNRLIGNKIFRLGFYKNNNLVGTCLAVKQNALRGPHFLIPGGPFLDWKDKKIVDLFMDAIQSLAKEENAWFIRMRPEIFDSNDARNILKSLGFIPSPMHLHAENTWVLNIARSDEEILSGMRKSTRYLVRRSLNSGLIFKSSKEPEKALILSKLQNETVARHKFVGFPQELFSAQLITFGKDNQASLFFVKKLKKVLAAAIVIFYGEYAYYHHSASSEESRDIPVSYYLQWQIIQEAKRRGCKFYNFWGISPTDNPKHRFAGVTLFKKGFGGERLDWVHAHDLPISFLYMGTYIFETARKKVRGL